MSTHSLGHLAIASYTMSAKATMISASATAAPPASSADQHPTHPSILIHPLVRIRRPKRMLLPPLRRPRHRRRINIPPIHPLLRIHRPKQIAVASYAGRGEYDRCDLHSRANCNTALHRHAKCDTKNIGTTAATQQSE